MCRVQSVIFGNVGRVFTAVAPQSAAPVVVDVVDVFEIHDIVFSARPVEAATAAVVVGQQVVVVGGRRAAPLGAISAGALGVAGVVEPFMYDAVLHGVEVGVEDVHVLFDRPAESAVVEDEVGAVLGAAGVLGENVPLCVFLSDAETHVAHDEVFGAAEVHLVVGDDNAVAGSALSRQRPVLAVDLHFRLQDDFARHGKYDGQRLVLVLFESPAQ